MHICTIVGKPIWVCYNKETDEEQSICARIWTLRCCQHQSDLPNDTICTNGNSSMGRLSSRADLVKLLKEYCIQRDCPLLRWRKLAICWFLFCWWSIEALRDVVLHRLGGGKGIGVVNFSISWDPWAGQMLSLPASENQLLPLHRSRISPCHLSEDNWKTLVQGCTTIERKALTGQWFGIPDLEWRRHLAELLTCREGTWPLAQHLKWFLTVTPFLCGLSSPKVAWMVESIGALTDYLRTTTRGGGLWEHLYPETQGDCLNSPTLSQLTLSEGDCQENHQNHLPGERLSLCSGSRWSPTAWQSLGL